MTKNKKIILSLAICLLFCLFYTSTAALAGNLNDAFKVSDGNNRDPLDTAATYANYNTSQTDVLPIFSKFISIGLSVLGIVFLMLIGYGGVLWMTDRGNEEEVAKAKKMIQAAVIGLVIVVSSYALSFFIMNVLAKNTLK
jgi:hypothetical protein